MKEMVFEKRSAELATSVASDLRKLCEEIGERRVGSPGNEEAAAFIEGRFSSLGWAVESSRFSVVDWREEGADLSVDGERYSVEPSPYSLGCDIVAPLVAATTLGELRELDARGRVLLLVGEMAKEQLMPKNFVFYNPDEHREIVSALESGGASAIVCATGHSPRTAGGIYPFPLIEDGDFDVPSVFTTEEEGRRLRSRVGSEVRLASRALRIPSIARNVIARRGGGEAGRIVVSAHLDAKRGSPGAIDDGTGVASLLAIAEILRGYEGDTAIELVAFNGEDYYAVPGEMRYIEENQGRFAEIIIDINIDGAGYLEGGSCLSFFGLPEDLELSARTVMSRYEDLSEGPQWPQGDHSIFVQFGRPAIAATSRWFIDNMDSQRITHTSKDEPGIVDCGKVARLSFALAELVGEISGLPRA